MTSSFAKKETPWQTIAITSGICAAFNGVFAKLTTNNLTSTWSQTLNSTLSLPIPQYLLEYILRLTIFGLSFAFTATMWMLYTRALSLSPSAVHVNIVNTSSNFIVTALLGALIFGERLPPLWWAGAALLISGGVIIGRREEGVEERNLKVE